MVISNCVVNLSTDKPAVLAEIARVLRPGGRIGISDVVAEDHLTPADRAARGSHAGCIAGALTFAEYTAGLTAAGLSHVTVTPTHAVADALHAAIIRGRKPPRTAAADRLPGHVVLDRRRSHPTPVGQALRVDGCGCYGACKGPGDGYAGAGRAR